MNFIAGLVVYDLDDSGLLGDGIGESSPGNFDGDAEGIFGLSFDFSGAAWVAGPGPFAACGTNDACGAVIVSIPEPASWGLFIGGFGLTGAALRRRRRRSVPA